jgi:hypothetical protein
MPTRSCFIESAAIPSVTRAGEFARAVARLMGLPEAWVDGDSSQETYSFTETRSRWGTSKAGVELFDRTEEIDRGHYTTDIRTFRISGYGLAQGDSVLVRFETAGAYCDVSLPSSTAVDGVLSAFALLVENRPILAPAPKDAAVNLERLLRSAANACTLGYWLDAEKMARQVLAAKPNDVHAQELLSRALERRSK